MNRTDRGETRRWLEGVKQALLDAGYKDTLLQIRKLGQVFGLVRDVSKCWQYHVRGFEDGHLESEFEISRHYLEHPDTSRPATAELRKILDERGIPYSWEGQLEAPIQIETEPPGTLTDWKPLLVIGVALAAGAAVAYLYGKK